jgi:hypothetical protein
MGKMNVVTVVWLLVFCTWCFSDFTIGVIPDTQNLSESDTEAQKIMKMLKFFVDKKDELNVVFVVSLGDMTQNNNVDSEWQRLYDAYNQLRPAGIPFAPMEGNHDAISSLNDWFPVSDFENTPTWGGSMDGGIENAYYLFSEEDMDFVIVITRYNYSNSVASWANGIFEQYSDRRGIFGTHNINQDSDWENGVVKQNDNLFMSVSGHRGPPPDGREENWTTESPSGNTQYNFMTDYQGGWVWDDKGATIRYYTFKPAVDSIYAYTWNTTHEEFETDENSEFSVYYDMESVTVVTGPPNIPKLKSRFTLSGKTAGFSYTLPVQGLVNISIYNSKGAIIKTLMNEYQSAGDHSAMFNLNYLSNGIYYCTMTAGSIKIVGKFIVLK